MNLGQIISFYLPTYQNGKFNEEDFNTDVVGTSDCNVFIPFYSIFGHESILFEKINKRVLEYRLPISKSNYVIRQYTDLISYLRSNVCLSKFLFKSQDIEHAIYIHRGILYDENKNILMCLAINSEYFLNTKIEEIELMPDINQFVLFISHEFNKIKYKNVRKKIDLEYLSFVRQLNIDIIETNKINQWLFKNNFKQPKFKNVIEMNKHLKEEIPMYLLID